jgi:beta-lactamase regulating signal transducer with metallopeptidase domain
MTALLDHLWQSSLFALAAGLLTLTLRTNAARIRFWLWFAASLKFLMPFTALVFLGERLARLMPAPLPPSLRVLAPVAEKFSAPAQALAPAHGAGFVLPLLLIWLAGFCTILGLALTRWLRLRALVRQAQALPLAAPVEVRASQSHLEPGLVGIFRPVVLLPQDLLAGLTSAERDGILAHEFVHLHHRDNLTAALHMLVEALFWFWPPVWLIGARLIAERERACDEGVIAAGHDPETYAGGILKVCRFCIRSPLACAAGASGADLSSRVRQIMSGEQAAALDGGRCALLTGATMLALGLPVMAGLSAAPLAVAVQRHVVAVQVRAAQAVTAVAEQIGMAPTTGRTAAGKVRKLPRMKVVVAEPVVPPPVTTSATTSGAAPDPSPPVVAQPAPQPAPETAPSQQAAAETAPPLTPAREVVLALDPRGNGDPDAVTCRVPQQLPASRLPGPEVCQTNRFWAALYAEGRRLGPDGLTLTATTRRFGDEVKFCPAVLLGAPSGFWANNTVLAACR